MKMLLIGFGAAIASGVITLQTFGQLAITQDTVQNGGELAVNPAAEVVIHGQDNPQLTLTNGAITNGVRSLLVGTSVGGDGSLVVDGASAFNISGPTSVLGNYGGVDFYGGMAFIGFNSGSTGSAVISGANSNLTTNSALFSGFYGNGHVTVEAGALVSNFAAYIGRFGGSSGQVTVTGADSKWDVEIETIIGFDGSAQLLVADGGELLTENAYMARSASSNGCVTVTGTQSRLICTDNLVVGRAGSASLEVLNGAYAESFDTFVGNFGGSGQITVSGAGSTFKPGDLDLFKGSMLIDQGATVTAHSFVVGGGSGTAALTVRGPGSTLIASSGFGAGGSEDQPIPGSSAIVRVENGGKIVSGSGGGISSNSELLSSVTITGPGSRWEVDGGINIESDNYESEVLIEDGATLKMRWDAGINIDNFGRFIVDNAHVVNSWDAPHFQSLINEGFVALRNDTSFSVSEVWSVNNEVSGGSRLKAENPSQIGNLALFDGGRFDLFTAGVRIFDMTDAEVRDLLKNGWNGGAWDGENGIVSDYVGDVTWATTSIGYANRTEIDLPPMFEGLQSQPTDVLAIWTLPGDTNLDRRVDFSDLLATAQHYGESSGAVWLNGDFTYDDRVDFSDLLLVAQSYGWMINENGSIISIPNLQGRFETDWILAQQRVPEPASLVAFGAGVVMLLRRRIP